MLEKKTPETSDGTNRVDQTAFIEYPILFKNGDDLRKDFFVIQTIELIKKVFDEENIKDVHIESYNVLPTGYKKGIIEKVESKPVSTIIKENTSIKAYLSSLSSNPNEQTRILSNYFKSCAGFLLANYIFGIGDRHYDNIMIKPDGVIFHIDFGFIMTDEPKKLPVIDYRFAPEIKWTTYIVEPILKDSQNLDKPFNDENYKELMGICLKGFQALRSKYT